MIKRIISGLYINAIQKLWNLNIRQYIFQQMAYKSGTEHILYSGPSYNVWCVKLNFDIAAPAFVSKRFASN